MDSTRDPDATAVSPLFDEESTVVAQPVVPLDDKSLTDDVGAFVQTGNAPPAYVRAWRHRTHWMVALVLVALVAGTVAGIIGLRLYQRGRAADEPARAAEHTPAQPDAQQAAPVATEETAPAQPAQSSEVAEGAVADKESYTGRAEELPAKTVVRDESGRSSVEELPETFKRGKKGEEDSEAGVFEPTQPPVYDTQGPAPAGSEAARRAAREEERLRRIRQDNRRERRGRRGQAVDSVRGIFEGDTASPPR